MKKKTKKRKNQERNRKEKRKEDEDENEDDEKRHASQDEEGTGTPKRKRKSMQGKGGVIHHGPREIPGGPWGGLGGPQNRRCFFRAFWEGPGGLLGWFWCSGMVLGTVLGCPNVDIYL